MAEMQWCHQCLWKSHVFHRSRDCLPGNASDTHHNQNLTSAKPVSTGLVFRLLLFPFFPSLILLLLDACHNYAAFTYPSVFKAYIKTTLTNIILIATCVICKVRVRDDLINHEYLFFIISNIQYGLSKEDFVNRFVYWSSWPEWE